MHVQDVRFKGAYLPPQGQGKSGTDWGIQKAALVRHTIDSIGRVLIVGLSSAEFMAMDKSSRLDVSSIQGRQQIANEILHAHCEWRIKLANVQNAHLKISRIMGPAWFPPQKTGGLNFRSIHNFNRFPQIILTYHSSFRVGVLRAIRL